MQTKLVRFGVRDYDPQLGRWTGKDPGLFIGGTGLFDYGLQDPVDLVDPTGLVHFNASWTPFHDLTVPPGGTYFRHNDLRNGLASGACQ